MWGGAAGEGLAAPCSSQVVNHGVEIVEGHKALVKRVISLAEKYYTEVPVLVIASSLGELAELFKMGRASSKMAEERVQRLAEFDLDGRSLKGQWATMIDDATKRVGLAGESSCRVTFTDRFGGRGHDFQVRPRVGRLPWLIRPRAAAREGGSMDRACVFEAICDVL